MSELTPERWQRIAVVLDTALELSPELCPAFLDIACAGDPELRSGVERFLALDARLRERTHDEPTEPASQALPPDPLAAVIARLEDGADGPEAEAPPPIARAIQLVDRALDRLADLDEGLARLVLLWVRTRGGTAGQADLPSVTEKDFRKASILLYETMREAT